MYVDINKLRVCIKTANGSKIVKLEKTPHYFYLNGCKEWFKIYVKKYAPSRDGPECFDKLYNEFDLLKAGEIKVYKKDDVFVILDGVYRSVIMYVQGIKKVKVCLS